MTKRTAIRDLQIDVNNVVTSLFSLRSDPTFERATKLADALAAEIEAIAARKRSQ
jgi:hypothetical protein